MRPDATDFLEFSDLSDAVVLETWGNLDLGHPGRARLEAWRDDDYKHLPHSSSSVWTGAWSPDPGSGLPLQENLQDAFLRVDVLQDVQRPGHRSGTPAACARSWPPSHGRTTLQTYTEHAPGFDPDGPAS